MACSTCGHTVMSVRSASWLSLTVPYDPHTNLISHLGSLSLGHPLQDALQERHRAQNKVLGPPPQGQRALGNQPPLRKICPAV